MTRRDHRAEYRRRDHGEADCPVCGATFTRLTSAQQLCSLRCAGRRGGAGPGDEAACACCGTTFRRNQRAQRFCSKRCADRDCRRRGNYGQATCPGCGVTFGRSWPLQRFCTVPCANRGQRSPTRDRVLALLERGRPVTSAELAGRLYGAADHWGLHAVHAVIHRLRQKGHQIASERDGLGQQRYRLVRAEAVA